MKLYKRLLSALLAFVMVLGMMPMSVLATETEEIPEASVLEETQAPEALPEETEVNEETEAPEEIPEETEAPEEILQETEALDEVPEVTEALEEITEETGASEEIPGLGARAGKTYSGSCGAKATWELNTATRTLVISGSGKMDDVWESPWYEYYGYIDTVIVMEGITAIGDNTFEYNEYIVEVSLPESLTYIGDSAFAYCYRLDSINLPDTVTEIANNAFYGCEQLTSVELPSGLKTLGDSAFGCTGLTEVTIPKGVRNWDIYSAPFAECDSLTTVYFEDGANIVPANFLAYCYALDTVVLPNSITEIHSGAFDYCEALARIELPAGLVVLEESAFAYSGLEEITLPDSLRTVEYCLFYECENLHTVNLPDSITCIEESAFDGCASLREVTLPAKLKRLENYAFYCSGLQKVFIHKFIEEFGYEVFAGCDFLKTVEFEEGQNSVPSGFLSNCDGLETVILPDTILEIEDSAFSGCTALENIKLPDTITHIHDGAFYGCTALEKIILPPKLKYLGSACLENTGITSITIPQYVEDCGGYSPFGDESSLTTITFADGMTKIPNFIADYTHTLTTVLIPESVTEIGYGTFRYCINLEKIVLPSQLEIVGGAAFYGCDSLTDISLPDTVVEIGDEAFRDCRLITQVTLPPVLERLGGSVFAGTHIKEIMIPKTLTQNYDDYWYYHNWSPFEECETLQKVIFEDGIVRIPDFILNACVTVKEVVIPASVKQIGSHAFYETELLKALTLPEGLESIEDYAFGYSDIETLLLPKSLTYIGFCAFESCDYLEEIKFQGKAPKMEEDIFYNTTTSVYYPDMPNSWTQAVRHDYCGDVTWVPVEHKHIETTITGYAPTCTAPGLTDGSVCEDCDDIVVKQEVIPPLGHDEVIDTGWEASCLEDGLTEGKHCARCSEILTEQKVIPALGHDEVIDPSVAAACEEDGLTEGKHCDRCKLVLVAQQVIPATGHFEIIDNAVAASCEETGLTAGIHCDYCGKILKEQEVIPALGHVEVIDPEVKPDCVNTGLTEGKHCDRCGKVLVAQEGIPIVAHQFTGGKCTVCGANDPDYVCEHEEGILEAVAPDCVNPGLTEGKYCVLCNAVLVAQEEIAPLGHVEVIDPKVEPTCIQEGLTEGKHCDICGEILIPQQPIPSCHLIVTIPAESATCEETGLTAGSFCANCGETLREQEVIPALGHDEYDEPGQDATCTASGWTDGVYCYRCDKEVVPTEMIPPLGHRFVDGECVNCGLKNIYSGECGDDLTWTFDGKTGVMTISGTGEMYDYDLVFDESWNHVTNAPWQPIMDCIYCVIIEDGVTSIGDMAFSDCINLTEVVMPDTVTRIGECAFESCYSLCSIDLSDNLKWLGSSAFGYSGLQEITIPNSNLYVEQEVKIGYMPEGPFQSCSLKTVQFEEGTKAVPDYLMMDAGVQTVLLPESVETIGAYAFMYCYSLNNIDLPSGLKSIREYAFMHCFDLDNVVIPKSVTYIGDYAFGYCLYMESVTFQGPAPQISRPNTNAGIYGTFAETTVIAYYPADDTTWTEAVRQNYGGDITWVPLNHQHTEEILEAVAPTCTESGLTEGRYCNVCGLILDEQLYVAPNGHSFENGSCIVCQRPEPDDYITGICGDDLTWKYSPTLGMLVISGTGPMYDYAFPNSDFDIDTGSELELPWYDFEIRTVIVEEGVTYIGAAAFESMYVGRIFLPESLRSVGAYAFANSNWIYINIPMAVTHIGEGAFSGCRDLRSVRLPECLTVINKKVFADCINLRSITIPESVTKIDDYAFINCASLNEIRIPDNVTTIGKYAFYLCDKLESIIIPDSVRTIDIAAFSECTALHSVVLPQTLEMLTDSVFAFSGIEGIEIPESVTQISNSAFAYCDHLDEVFFLGEAPDVDANAFAGTETIAYYPAEDPTWTEEVRQDYGGKITWKAYGEAPNLNIATENNLGFILSGKKLQLAALKDGIEADVTWSVLEGESYVSVSKFGMVTAKNVERLETITILAVDEETGAEAVMHLTILPKGAKLEMLLDGEPVTDTLVIDMAEQTDLQLTARLLGEEIDFTWTAENNWVEDGHVTIEYPGIDTVTAEGPYGITGTVKLDIYYLDPAAKLTASADIPAYGLQQGESARLTVAGSNVIDPSWLDFRSSDEDVVTVDSDGIITGVMPGTAKITAAIIGDPEGREVTLTVKVIPMQAASLDILYEGESVEEVRFDAAELGGESDTFTLEPLALTLNGSEIPQNAKSIKWTCSNSKLATIKTNSDGSATVTIKAGAEGACEITAQTTDLAKIAASITLAIMDRSPKLGSNSVTLNPAQESGADLVLVSSYDNDITDVYIDSDVLEAAYDSEAGLLNVYALEEIRNGTIKTTLTVTCVDGYDYYFDLKVSIKNSIPSVTVKQLQKLDLFYTDSEAELSVTAKDAQVDWNATELIDTQDFQLENGILTFTDTLIEGMQDNPRYRPDTRATLLVYLEDYLYPVEKNITIGTSTSRMTLTTDPGSGIINTAMSSDYRVYFSVLNKSEKEVLPLKYEDVTCDESYNVDENGEISITFEEAKKGTVTLQIQKENWMKAIEVKHKVSVEEKLPTVKLSATTLKLSSLFKNQTAIATVALNQGNMNIVHFSNGDVFETTAKEGSDAAKEAAKISVTYDGGQIYARIKAGKTPKAGTYTYTAVPYVVNQDGENIALKTVTIKVNVNATAPKIKLGASTVKLNTLLMGDEVAKIPVTLNDNTGYGAYIHTFEGMDKYEEVQMRYEDGMLYVSLLGGGEDKYSYTLTPVVRDEVGSEAKLPTVKLTVQSFHSKNIGISQSGKGKLDTLDPASSIVYTISKLTNMQGSVESVELVGGEDVFELSELGVDAKGKQFFTLKLKAGAQVRVNENYELRFRYGICGIILETPVQKVKVSQSNVKASAPAITFFQSQSQPMYVGVTANAPIDKVIINKDKTAKELVQALALTEDRIIDVGNMESVGMNLSIPRPGGLTPGKTYKLVLDVIPVGNAENAKITQITVNVKVGK